MDDIGTTGSIMTPATTGNSGGWKQIARVPEGWMAAVRKTCPDGSHATVLVSLDGVTFKVTRAVDHGFLVPDVKEVGCAHTLHDALEIMWNTCRERDRASGNPERVTDRPLRKWFYVTEKGIQGPTDRENLFGLLEANAIDWDTSVMLECHGIDYSQGWEPLFNALGLPAPVSSDRAGNWIGWVTQFVFGSFFGVFTGGVMVIAMVTALGHGMTIRNGVFLVAGVGLIGGALATQQDIRHLVADWAHPSYKLKYSSSMKQTALIIGLIGLGMTFSAVLGSIGEHGAHP